MARVYGKGGIAGVVHHGGTKTRPNATKGCPLTVPALPSPRFGFMRFLSLFWMNRYLPCDL